MDHNQESFLKPPFYMTYPMQNLYQAEMEYEKDMERMKEFYPAEVRKMLHCIEDQCDELEYEGSPMYDEYPDRLMFEKLADKIYNIWKAQEGQTPLEELPLRAMSLEENRFPMPEEFRMMPEDDAAEDVRRTSAVSGTPRKKTDPAALQHTELKRSTEVTQDAGFTEATRGTGHAGMPQDIPIQKSWERVLLGVLLSDEIYRRRCRNRRSRRWW